MSTMRTVRSALRLDPRGWAVAISAISGLLLPACAFASELDLKLPTLDPSQRQLLFLGIGVCVLGMLFGLVMFQQVKRLPAHQSMLDVSQIIYETCKTRSEEHTSELQS